MDGQVIWITGLSGAGKTTVAEALARCFEKHGLMPILLDGDILRNLFNNTDGSKKTYALEERIKLSYQYSLLCKILSSQGFTVIISTISMYDEIYAWNRKNLPNYSEIYLQVPLRELRRRDPKSIYKNFTSGTQTNVMGLDLKVDQPTQAHLVINFKSGQTPQEIADIIFETTFPEELK
jgi:cytidine diphosphoramidate kinase